MAIRKWFVGLIGIAVFVSMFFCVKLNVNADAAFGDDFWNVYEAIVVNPNGIDIKGGHFEYGSSVTVWDEYENASGVYVYISKDDDMFEGKYIPAAGNIVPADEALDSYDKADFSVLTYAETKLYSLPSLSSQVINTVPSGTKMKVTHVNGPWYYPNFGYAEKDGYAGWVVLLGYDGPDSAIEGAIDYGRANIRPTVLKDCDWNGITLQAFKVVDDSFNETDEIIPAGSKVHVIGENDYAVFAEINGKKILSDSRKLIHESREYKLHITSPDRVSASMGWDEWKDVEVTLKFDDVLPALEIGNEMCLYGDSLRIKVIDFYNMHVQYNSITGSWDCRYNDNGCFLEDFSNIKVKIKTYNDLVCFEDLDCTVPRSTWNKGKNANVFLFYDDEYFYGTFYSDELGYYYAAYVEGYGWVDLEKLAEALDENQPEESQTEEPKEEEPKQEEIVKVYYTTTQARTLKESISYYFNEVDLASKSNANTIEAGKAISIILYRSASDEEFDKNGYTRAYVYGYGWVDANELLGKLYAVGEAPKSKESAVFDNPYVKKTRTLFEGISYYDVLTLESKAGTIGAGNDVEVYFYYPATDSADDESCYTNAWVSGYGWVDVKEILAKSYAEGQAPKIEEPKPEEPKPAEPKPEQAEPVVPKKQNPIVRTLVICIVFAVVIAGAAVFGIVKLSKKKNTDK